MQKTFSILLAVAIMVFGYKILPSKSATNNCSCVISIFSVKNLVPAQQDECQIGDNPFGVDSRSTVDSVSIEIFNACRKVGGAPNPDYVSQLVNKILDKLAQCPREAAYGYESQGDPFRF